MALELDFSVCQSDNCKFLEIKDTTGVFSDSNPGGWGAPNPTIASATAAKIKVTLPNTTTAVVIDAFPTLPNTTNTPFTIFSDDLGLAADLKLEDGLYKIEYEVVTPSGTFTQKKDIFLYCNTKCVVHSLLADIDVDDCLCKSDNLDKALLAYTLFRVLVFTAACGQSDKFDRLIKFIDKLCKDKTCKTC